MPSLGTDRSLNTQLYQETGKVEFVTRYSVFDDKTGKTTYYDNYQAAADYMNSIGGSAMSTAELQKTVQQSGGAVNAVYLDGKQVDLQTGKVQDEVLLDQNEANATGRAPAEVAPTVAATPAPTSEVPATQEFGNTDGYGSQNELPDPSASEIQDFAAPVTPSPASGQIAYDDEGNLLPGWTVDEGNNPIFLGGDFVDPTTAAQAEADRTAAFAAQARQQQTLASQRSQINNGDWRVKMYLAPGAKYLYNAADPGILKPLQVSGGVIFPYTPQITMAYQARYSEYDLTHSNYRGYFYQNSFVDAININATFTAQSTSEADYLLAVIHFFRSATKMFYGQDAERGTPPPLVFLNGLGTYQLNKHPCLIQQFNYNLPSDVDYIRAGSVTNNSSSDLFLRRDRQSVATSTTYGAINRLAAAFLSKGALQNKPAPAQLANVGQPTYVPTKIDIQLRLLPVQTRDQVSKQFSVKEFANGNLLRGGFW